MAKEKIIKNNVVWENFRLQEELNGFQGNLKIEDKKLNKKLQDRIIKVWFNAPIFIWLNDQKFYILDWHQRLQALSELSKRGYTLEWWKIPVVEILADTEIEAKERIMDYSSAYALFDIPVLQGRSQELDMEFTNIPELSLDTPSMGDEFDLPSDEKGDLWQMTFIVHKNQKELIESAIEMVQGEDFGETRSNTNKNGNAIAFIIRQYLNGLS